MKRLLILLIIGTMILTGCKAKLELIDVDCSDLSELLEDIMEKDQSTRMEEDLTKVDFKLMKKIDLENLGKVVSIIEQCGMPTSDKLDKLHIETIFFVLQHSSAKYQKRYFSMLKESAKRGDLNDSMIAMMEDRMLMDAGEPQIYGTQLRSIFNSNKSKLYKLDNPEYVDKRRREVGLGPLSEYLEYWNVEFDVVQKE